MKISILVIVICFVNQISSYCQNRSDLEKRRNSLLKEISETENILSSVKQNKSESLEKLSLLDKKIGLRNSVIANLSTEVGNVENRITELEKATNTLSVDIQNIKMEYARMIYLAYLKRSGMSDLLFLFSSANLNQAYKRVKYIQQYSEYRKKQISIINDVQLSLQNQIKELGDKKIQKVKLLANQEQEIKTLKNELDEKTQTINVLKSKEKELSAKLREKTKRAEKLASEIDRIIKEEIVAKSKSGKVSKKFLVEDNTLSKSFSDNMGKLPWPTEKGVVTRGFGKYRDPIYKNVEIENLGIDISTISNSNVYCIFDGQVTDKFLIPGLNYTVIINHGKFYTVYQNLIDVRVKKDDKVKIKQIIGKVATDSESKASVLYFCIWDQRKKLNPESWLIKN